MVSGAEEPTLLSLAQSFTSFLTVAIHSILFVRHVYPAETFLTTRAYNFPVHQSRHPKVCEWINAAVGAVQNELVKGTVANISVVIFEPEGRGRALERFVFDLTRWPVVPLAEIRTPFVREGDGDVSEKKTPGSSDVDVDEQFRAIMSKVVSCEHRLRPVPEGCTFTVAVELKDDADPPVGHPQPWIPCEPSLQKVVVEKGNEQFGGDRKTVTKRGKDIGGVRTVPIRAVDAGEMVFELWVEEGAAKEDEKAELPTRE